MTTVIFSLAMLFGTGNIASAATPPRRTIIDKKLPEFRVQNEDEFVALCKKLHRGCGIEVPPKGSTTRRESRKLKNVTPREILDEYVSKNPAYRWTEENGTVNLRPRTFRGEDVLSRKLKSVSIHGASGFKACLDVLQQAGIKSGYEIMGRPPHFAPVNLDLKDVTVRDALNAIAAADGEFIWLFRWSHEKQRGMLNIISWRRAGQAFSPEEKKRAHDAKPEKELAPRQNQSDQ